GQEIANSLNKKHEDKTTPPPIPTREEKLYHIAIDSASEGPYDTRSIKNMIIKGTIDKDTLVWSKGMKDWDIAENVFESYFENTPPPLPKKP
ncbi:MAG: DUF4339 domain-containing protein, partial [Sulfurovaceae bacterium]|nr:DUF4339 domain-containing protein [Sulfurovaceae bacterium]